MKYTHNPGKRCQFFKHLRVGKISYSRWMNSESDINLQVHKNPIVLAIELSFMKE